LYFVLFCFFYIYILFGRVTSHRASYRRVEIKYIIARGSDSKLSSEDDLWIFSLYVFMIYIRHYDIYRKRYIFFFYYYSLYFSSPQNPDIIIMGRGSRVARKIFEIDLFVSVLVCYYLCVYNKHISRYSAGHLYDDDVITKSLDPSDIQVLTLHKKKHLHQTIS